MRQKSITLIVGFMTVAVLGVMAMQYYFIMESYRLKVQLFNQSVHDALNSVVYKVEKRDAANFLKRKDIRQELNPDDIQNRIDRFTNDLRARQFKIEREYTRLDSFVRANYPRAMQVNNDFYETYIKNKSNDDLAKVRVESQIEKFLDPYGRIVTNETYQLFAEDAGRGKLKKSSSDSLYYFNVDNNQIISLPRGPADLKAAIRNDQKLIAREKRVLDSVKDVRKRSSVFEDIAKDYEQANIPFNDRVGNPLFIDTLLKLELANRDIHVDYDDYDYEITSPDSRTKLFSTAANKKVEILPSNMFKTALFPKEIGQQSGVLTLIFLNKGNHILANMGMVLFSSISLLLVIICCFIYTILTILRQKKISEMKTDFINNMTHEFKTPVATIMIASEALKDPEVTESEKRIKRLANIIYDENVRLGNHIERVLNIAKIDRDDLKLEYNDVEMNDLIAGIVDSMELQLEKKNAKISLSLNAENAMVNGDELHLSNVMFNLIDNAIKYSRENPEIHISTHNSGNNLIIRVKDNGIGMSRDQLSKIFDQFYRIPTGNLHDVKGFGLGLSYVSNIVKRLQGSVHVKSEKNKGSEFELTFRTV